MISRNGRKKRKKRKGKEKKRQNVGMTGFHKMIAEKKGGFQQEYHIDEALAAFIGKDSCSRVEVGMIYDCDTVVY